MTRKCTKTDYYLLQNYFTYGFPSGVRDDEQRPYVVPRPNKLLKDTWEDAIIRVTNDPTYWGYTGRFCHARETTNFVATINRASPVLAEPDPVNTAVAAADAADREATALDTANSANESSLTSSSSGVRHGVAPEQAVEAESTDAH